MKRALAFLFVVLAATALVLTRGATASSDDRSAEMAVGTHRQLWETMTRYVTMSAEEVSEGDYAYRPTQSVRSFGELIGHVAGAQYMMCAAAMGEPPRAEDEIEKSAKTKAALVAALKASTEYCARAYAQTDAAAGGQTKLFGQDMTRLYALGLNAVHNGEHYGNIVTYMRMKGMVPPSSRPSP
jgi:uncharacterized damage-inducible protein DinB